MTLHEQLRYIQHHWIPWLFYNEGEPFLRDLLFEKGKLFIDLLNFVNYDDPNYTCPYQLSDFRFSKIKPHRFEGNILRIIMPPPVWEAHCQEVFLAYSSDLKQRFYFTLELNTMSKNLIKSLILKRFLFCQLKYERIISMLNSF